MTVLMPYAQYKLSVIPGFLSYISLHLYLYFAFELVISTVIFRSSVIFCSTESGVDHTILLCSQKQCN